MGHLESFIFLKGILPIHVNINISKNFNRNKTFYGTSIQKCSNKAGSSKSSRNWYETSLFPSRAVAFK